MVYAFGSELQVLSFGIHFKPLALWVGFETAEKSECVLRSSRRFILDLSARLKHATTGSGFVQLRASQGQQ